MKTLLVTPRGAEAPAGRLRIDERGVVPSKDADPALKAAAEAMRRAEYLPLTIRQTVGGARHITLRRLTPAEPDYWQAVVEALGRQGYSVSEP